MVAARLRCVMWKSREGRFRRKNMRESVNPSRAVIDMILELLLV